MNRLDVHQHRFIAEPLARPRPPGLSAAWSANDQRATGADNQRHAGQRDQPMSLVFDNPAYFSEVV